MSEQEVYKGFIDRLQQGASPLRLPETDELLSLVMAAYTVEEASLLTGMPFSAKNVGELAEMKQMAPDDLRPQLEALARKGLVYRSAKGDEVRYRLNDALFVFFRSAFWPGRTDEVSKAMAPLVNQYYYHGFWDHTKHVQTQGLRALPVEGTIEHTHNILPYEDAVKVIDSKEYYAVSTCPCRHRKNIDPDSPNCSYNTEVCIHFDNLGRYTVENGFGRQLTREEAHELLHQCAEDGLVHGLSNMQEGGDTICNCCKCCCLFFEAFHKLKHGMSVSPSNYLVHTNPELCIGCGQCVRRCHMEALRLEDSPEAKDRITTVAAKDGTGRVELKNKKGKVAVLNPELCIGCGVCAYKCSSQSLVLEPREVIIHPPKDAREYARMVNAELAAAGVIPAREHEHPHAGVSNAEPEAPTPIPVQRRGK